MCPPAAETTPPAAFAEGGAAVLHRLAASLAHNVNNALTGVIGYLDLGLRHASLGSEQEKHLRASLTCAHRAAEAVRRIVTFLCQVRAPEALTPVSLRGVAEEAAEAVRIGGPAGITVAVEGVAGGWALADVMLVRAALDPLVENALEAMPDGGTLTLRVEPRAGWCGVAVIDTGSGMPELALAQAFEPFVTTKPSGHLGLGLALCREMVRVQGGRVDLCSARGRGTTVEVAFPAVEVPEGHTTSLPAENLREPPPAVPPAPPSGPNQRRIAIKAS